MTGESTDVNQGNNETADHTQAASTDAPNWWIDEGMPGSGARPEWLGDKFKSAADLAKSYSELEKRVGTAPEDYDFSKADWIDADYEPFIELKEFAKSKRVSQEVMDKMLDSVSKYLNEFTIDYAEESKKLGENAKERVTTLQNWATSNLSEKAVNALLPTLNTAESVLALEEIRNKMMENSTQIPSGNDNSSNSGANLDDIRAEMSNNLDKYKTDPAYRREMQQKFETASKTQNDYIDKHG